MTFDTFNNFDDFFQRMHENRQAADEAAEDWQKSCRPGDYVYFYDDNAQIWIFGELLDDSEIDAESTNKYGRWYSVIVPEGELGFNHCARYENTMTAAQFTAARADGWQALDVA